MADITKELETLRRRVAELEDLQTERERGKETPLQAGAEKRYRAILESYDEGLVVLDTKDRVIDANNRLEEITGYKRSDLFGKTALSLARLLTHKGLTVFWRNPLKRTIDSNAQPYEIDVFKKNGELVTVLIKYHPLKLDSEVMGRLVILRDVTALRCAERESGNSQEVARSLLNHAAIGIFRTTPGATGRFLEVNPAMEAITGYSREELLQINVADLYVNPAERAEHIIEVLSGTLTKPREIHFKKKDGTEIVVRDKKVVVKGNDNKTLYLEGFLEDITERKRAEEALKESEENFRNSLDNSPMGIRISDRKDDTLYANQAFLNIFGYENIEDLRASPPLKHYTPEAYADFIMRMEKQRIGAPRPDSVEIDIVRKDGNIRHLRLSTRELVWYGKQQFQNLYIDITVRKQAERALKASEENFRNSLDSSLMGIRIVDTEWHTLYVNQVFLDIFGFKNIDEVGRTSLQDRYTTEEHARYLQRKEKRERGETVPDNPVVEIVDKEGAIHHIKVYLKEVLWDGKQQRQLIYHDVTELQQSEKALKTSEENFRNSMDNSTMGIRIMGDHDYTLYANQALLDMFGYKNIEELRASPPQEHYTPESYAGFIRRKERFARGELLPDTLEFDIIRKDGAIRHLQLFNKEVLWNDRKQHQFLYNDITDRKNAEQALQASEQNFRNSLDHSLDGIRISDIKDHTSYVNKALLDTFGYENIEEVIAHPPQDFYAPEDHANWVLRHEKLLRGEPVPDKLEVNIIRKDGAIRHLEVSLREVFWDGRLQYQAIFHDITEHAQAEKALHESEEKYRLIVENSTDIIFTLNTQGEFIYLSPSVEKVLGYNQDDLLGLPFRSLVHPEDVHVIDEAQQSHNVDGGQTTVNDEYRFRHASGEWRWLISTGVPMREQYESVFNFIGIARDVTEQKQMETDLKESEKNFRNSIDSSSMGIHIVNKDWDTLYANQAFLDIFGYESIEELRVSHQEDRYTPESYANWVLRHEKMLRGEPVPDKLEADIVRKDGTIRHIQAFRKEVLWNGKTQYQLLYNDVTEQKQAQKRIEQAAAEWRTTFDSITDLISIHDKDNRIIRVNKAVANLLKKTPQELIGKACHEVMRGDQECPANCPQLLALKTGKSSSLEIFNPNLGLHFQESASPLFNEKGEITGSVLVARDVTQQKRMEEQLMMTDRLASIGELSSGIAHELNNPLTSVIGFSQLLMEGDVPANMKEDLGTVYSEAQRAAAIVKNLLTFARKHAPVKSLSQVNAVIEDVLRLRAYEQKVNNIEIENRLAANLPEIMIDHFQMQQVFLNIMVNAEFAMLEAHHKGKLVITTEKSDGVIKITFTDDGSGIAEENLKRIFDPFFTTKEVGKGTGLGLSICHGIVTEHGGKIYASSVKGQGATFVVELPLINEQ